MQKLLIIACTSIALCVGCQAKNAAEMDGKDALKQEQGDTVQLSNKKDIYERKPMGTTNTHTHFGYSRMQKNDRTSMNPVASVNRENLSNIITDMEVKLPDVTDAATLVTDDEIFVVYRANTTDPKLVADQVQKTALSVVPSYYHVYVSDNTKLMSQMEGLKSGKLSDKEYTGTIDMFIAEMHKNPHINNQQNEPMHDMMK